MISRSKDGEFTARVGNRLGYTPIRGSSSRGAVGALYAMVRFLKTPGEKRLCGTAVDGPKGPARKMKGGMLELAQKSGACFIPITCSGTRLINLSRSWDQTIIPKPFSRVLIDFGSPVFISPDISNEAFESLRLRVESELNRLTDSVDHMCGYRPT